MHNNKSPLYCSPCTYLLWQSHMDWLSVQRVVHSFFPRFMAINSQPRSWEVNNIWIQTNACPLTLVSFPFVLDSNSHSGWVKWTFSLSKLILSCVLFALTHWNRNKYTFIVNEFIVSLCVNKIQSHPISLQCINDWFFFTQHSQSCAE